MSEVFFIPRNITERSWTKNYATFYLFIRLLLRANEQGEIVTSVAELARELNLKVHQVRYGMVCLRNDNRIVYQGTNKYTKITICEYDSYIEPPQEMEDHASSEQILEQKNAPLLPPDGSSPCTPSSLTPYIPQETKKTAVAAKETAKRFTKPSVEDIRDYILENHYDAYGIDAEEFFNNYESKGWVVGKSPMKNWKAAVCTWVSKAKKRAKATNQPIPKTENLRSSKELRKLMNNG